MVLYSVGMASARKEYRRKKKGFSRGINAETMSGELKIMVEIEIRYAALEAACDGLKCDRSGKDVGGVGRSGGAAQWLRMTERCAEGTCFTSSGAAWRKWQIRSIEHKK
jgi:hypothetical protein